MPNLTKIAGLSARRARRALRELEASGYIDAVEYRRVHAAAAADLARHRLCLATKAEAPGAVCHLDAGHKPPHRARVGERIETPRGPRRQIIEWGAK